MFATVLTVIKGSKIIQYALYIFAIVLFLSGIYTLGYSKGTNNEKLKLTKEYTEVITKINEENSKKFLIEINKHKQSIIKYEELKRNTDNKKVEIKEIIKRDVKIINKECVMQNNTKDKFNNLLKELDL